MSIRNPRLPFLPGLTPNPLLGRKSFGMRPIFTAIDGIRMLIDKQEKQQMIPSLYARKQTPELPTWIMFDKQILRFDGFFQQSLHEMRCGTCIVRKVTILFFLEDGTIKVMEPRVENSGLNQGVLISRQRIRLPNSYDTYYDVLDLNIGREVEFFGKVFMITNCDNFTRVFLNRLGINVPDPLPMPPIYGGKPKRPEKILKPKEFGLKNFIENDRKVLRFYGYWDDRKSIDGVLHRLEVHYFLADNTIEIKEVLPPNSGITAGPMFLKRMRLPKKPPDHIEMTGGPPVPSYTPADLTIGAVMNVYGREVTLTDCDPYTKEYYREIYGIDNFTPMAIPEEHGTCVSTAVADRELPPWNGYGTYEDSAQNCRTVEPKAPHADFMKFLHKDRSGFDSHQLRFSARIINDNPIDKNRYFIITYFLSDDTIMVFELAYRNSGFTGGRFFKRSTVFLPNTEKFAPNPPPTYGTKDMWIGNEIVINDHRFRLVGADEYAIRYMELNSNEYHKANVPLIMDKIRLKLASKENAYKDFVSKYMNVVLPENKDLMSAECFRQALKEILCDNMTEHEFITLCRYFRGDPGIEKSPRREMVRSLVFSVLTNELWNARERLQEALMHADESGKGYLSRHRMRQVLRGNRLPLSDELMDCMLSVLEKDPDCNISCADLMKFLDFKIVPSMKLTEDDKRNLVRHAPPVKHVECKLWTDLDSVIKDGYVNWSSFICQLNLEHLVKDNK